MQKLNLSQLKRLSKRFLEAPLNNYEPIDWKEIQNASVQIWGQKVEHLKLEEIKGRLGMYSWPYQYDDFIGYMAGIISLEELNHTGFAIL